VTAGLRITDNQRLRDFAAHLRERGRESGAAFQDGHSSVAEHARGIQWAITEEVKRYRRHDQLRWFIDGRPLADESNIPRGRDSQIAAFAGFDFEEVGNTVENRRAKYGRPLRERQKPGRKPLGDRAMTSAERVRNHRDRKKSA
jgi:hypothetical protein